MSRIFTSSQRIGSQTVHLFIFAFGLNGFTEMIGLHSVIQYHSMIVALGDFLENLVNNSFGHFSAHTIAKRRESSWFSFADWTIQFKNVGVEASREDFVC